MQWLHTIYHTEMKTGTPDGWSAWLRGSRLLCGLHHHTWQFFPAQLCRCQNLLRIFDPFSTIVLRPESKLCLGDRVKRILSTRGWSSCAACFLGFFFLQLALYPVNSALLVDSAHPSFCVPSSFYWLDLWQLFAGCLNGFRQLLELVWTPEALTKSTLYPGPTGMGSSIITREADLEVPSGNRKHKLDAHQKRITKKSFKCNSSHSFSKGEPTQMPPLSQDTTWDTNQLRRKHVGQFVLLSLDNDTSSCMLMHLRG